MKMLIYISIVICFLTPQELPNHSPPSNKLYYEYSFIEYDQIECLTQNVYFESRSESEKGQYAVANVTINRSKSEIFPQTICDVVQQKRNDKCQFSWWCDEKLRDQIEDKTYDQELYQQAKLIAIDTYMNHDKINVGTKGALFYHAKYVKKKKLGVAKLHKTAIIGKHIFYAFRG